MYSDRPIRKRQMLRLVLVVLGASCCINGECINDFEGSMLRKAINWHNFWFLPRMPPIGSRVLENGIKIDASGEVSYLIWPSRFWIRATSSPERGKSVVDIQRISDDKELERREVLHYMSRLADNSGSATIKECDFGLPITTAARGDQRSPESIESWYKDAIVNELRRNQQWHQCPCTIWIAPYTKGDLKAFVLVSGGAGESVGAFSVDYDQREVREQLGKWISPRDPLYREFVERVKRYALVEII